MRTIKKAFVAATTNDLPEHRAYVTRRLQEAGIHVFPSEDWSADFSSSPSCISQSRAAECDLLVLLVAWTRGTIPQGEHRSITQLEYDAAEHHGLETLVFLLDPDAAWYREHDNRETDPEIEVWRRELQDGGVTDYFNTDPESVPIQKALTQLLIRLPDKERPPSSAPTTPHQLSPPGAGFVGRTKEMDALLSAVRAGAQKMLLWGMPGVGKTSLANAVAQELMDQYPDGQIVLDMKGADSVPLDPATAIARVLSSIAPHFKTMHQDIDLSRKDYLSALHAKRVLILADNAADADQIGPLSTPPGSFLLVTSRRTFHLPGSGPPFHLETLTEADAVVFLESMVPKLGRAGTEIARLCGWLPLALQLAGAAMVERSDMSPDYYAKLLGNEQSRKKELGAVYHSIAMSHGLLSDDARLGFPFLSVFAGNFSLSGAAALLGVSEEDAHDVVGSLLRFALVEWNRGTEQYSIHDLVREFGSEILPENDRELARSRHAEFFLKVLTDAEAKYLGNTENQRQGIALYLREQLNIHAGIQWAIDRRDSSPIAATLCWKYPEAGLRVMQAAERKLDKAMLWRSCLDAARKENKRRVEGVALRRLAHYDNAGESLLQLLTAIQIAREVGNKLNEAQALQVLSGVYVSNGQPDEGKVCAELSLDIAQYINNPRMEAYAVRSLGTAYTRLGLLDAARGCFQRRRELARELGDLHSEAIGTEYLANTAILLGLRLEAADLYLKSADTWHHLGLHVNELNMLSRASLLLLELGRGEALVGLSERALGIVDLQSLETYRPKFVLRRAAGLLALSDAEAAASSLSSYADHCSSTEDREAEMGALRAELACRLQAKDDAGAARTLRRLNRIESVHQDGGVLGGKDRLQSILGEWILGRKDRGTERIEELLSDSSVSIGVKEFELLATLTKETMGYLVVALQPRRAIALGKLVLKRAVALGLETKLEQLPNTIGFLYAGVGEYEKAQETFAADCERYGGDETSYFAVRAEANRAFSTFLLGDSATSIPTMRKLIARCEELDDEGFDYLRAMNEANLARALASEEDGLDEARELSERALPLIRKHEHREQEPEALCNLARVALRSEDSETAITLCASAVAIATETGAIANQYEALWLQGESCLANGDIEAAVEAFGRVVEYDRAIGHTQADAHAQVLATLVWPHGSSLRRSSA